MDTAQVMLRGAFRLQDRPRRLQVVPSFNVLERAVCSNTDAFYEALGVAEYRLFAIIVFPDQTNAISFGLGYQLIDLPEAQESILEHPIDGG